MTHLTFKSQKIYFSRNMSVGSQKLLDTLTEYPNAEINKLIIETYKKLGCKTLSDVSRHWYKVSTLIRDCNELRRKLCFTERELL